MRLELSGVSESAGALIKSRLIQQVGVSTVPFCSSLAPGPRYWSLDRTFGIRALTHRSQALTASPPMLLTTTPKGRYHRTHFMEVEPEVWRGEVGRQYRAQKLSPRILESKWRFEGHEDRKKEGETGQRSA